MDKITIEEKLETVNRPGSIMHGCEVFTATVYCGSEAIDSFGGEVGSNPVEETKAKAVECANKWAGLKELDILGYDAYIQTMDKRDWQP